MVSLGTCCLAHASGFGIFSKRVHYVDVCYVITPHTPQIFSLRKGSASAF